MNEKVKPEEEITSLTSQVKSIGYYAGLTFGAGYTLIFFGIIFIFVEMVLRALQAGVLHYIGDLPPWRIITLVFIFIGLFFGVVFGSTITKNAKSLKESSLNLNKISSSASVFSLMLLFLWFGSTISAFVNREPSFSSVCGIVGSALFLIGLGRYREKTSRFVGTIIMLISLVLIYFVAYWNLQQKPVNGLLFSELTIEVVSLLILGVCAAIFSLSILQEELKQTVFGLILSIVGIVFSAGVLYLNFSALSAFSISTPIDQIPYINNLPGCSILLKSLSKFYISGVFAFSEAYSALIIFAGFLILGISGIIGIITACLALIIFMKQVATGSKA